MNDNERKKEIIKELILKEEDVIKKFERLVKLAANFIEIEETTGRVLIKNEIDLSYPEKIFLIALGKYFAHHYEIIDDYSISIQEIGEELGGIPISNFSKSLSKHVDDKILNRQEKGVYKINPYQIEKYLRLLDRKYIQVKNVE